MQSLVDKKEGGKYPKLVCGWCNGWNGKFGMAWATNAGPTKLQVDRPSSACLVIRFSRLGAKQLLSSRATTRKDRNCSSANEMRDASTEADDCNWRLM
jgi:hypothetical protein